MQFPSFSYRKYLALLLFISLLTACSAESRRTRYVRRAENFFQTGDYEKAKLEYVNAIRAAPQEPLPFKRLGTIWMEQGAPLRAGPFLTHARDLAPDDLETRILFARVLITVGALSDARDEALAVLARAPGSGEAIYLLADASRTKEELAALDEQLQKFPQRNDTLFLLASATASLRKGDLPAAEKLLQQANAADPKSPRVHTLQAAYCLTKEDFERGKEELKTAAELAPLRSQERIQYAEFLTQSGATAEATAVLKPLTEKVPDLLPAWRVLAQIAFREKRYDEAVTLLQNVMRRDPENPLARMMEADILIAQGAGGKALESLKHLDDNLRNAPGVRLQLARAHLVNNDVAQASNILNQAIQANPDYYDAILLLGEINLQTGNAPTVIASMQDVLKKAPNLSRAQLLLADAYRAVGRVEDAANIFRQQIKASPNSADPYLLLGLVLRQQNKPQQAREALEKAAELAPKNLVAVNQLVDMDLAEGNFERAMQRVRQQAQQQPDSPSANVLEAKVYIAQHDWTRAEAALTKVLDANADIPSASQMLVTTFVGAGKLPEAVKQLEAFVAKNPDNPGALMTLALVCSETRQFDKAREAYEKILALKPDLPLVLNNLAYVYAEHLGDLERAYDLARKARTAQPADPSIADTLGWVLYKRGDYKQALVFLEEAASKSPGQPEVQFHRGMANYMMGQTDAARAALQEAVKSEAEFPGKEEARRRLALIAGGARDGAELSVAELEAFLKEQPKDAPVAVRLAEAYETQGAWKEAAGAYEKAIAANPTLVKVLIKLAELYAGPLNSQPRALEVAKRARELAPGDPRIAGLLGKLAFKTGNSAWAYSLLQESARQATDDPSVLHSLAWAAYNLGKLDEAREAMQAVARSARDPALVDDARTFLAMLALPRESAEKLLAAESDVEKILQAHPDYVPALMVRASIQTQQRQAKTAAETYTSVLSRVPDFAPAQKALAMIYASKELTDLAKAQDLASKARQSMPNDAEIVSLLADISYQRKDYARAVQLLQETARRRSLSARELHLLGMAQMQSKNNRDGIKTLTAALSAGLEEPLAEEARQAIAAANAPK